MPHALLVQDTQIPLEDPYTDVLGKAQRGRHLTDAEVAHRSGISLQELSALKEGHYRLWRYDRERLPDMGSGHEIGGDV